MPLIVAMQIGPDGLRPPLPGRPIGARTGDPTWLSAPVAESMDKTETEFDFALSTKRNWSDGSVVTKPPSVDSETGEPGTGVSVPSSATENPTTCEVVPPPGIEA